MDGILLAEHLLKIITPVILMKPTLACSPVPSFISLPPVATLQETALPTTPTRPSRRGLTRVVMGIPFWSKLVLIVKV